MAVTVGAPAPAFSAKDQTGTTVSLSDFAGKYVVLYFYPKDDTPGCTVEACNFRDDHSQLQAAGAVVLGVSPDSEASHQKFIAKHKLPFQLLVDSDNAITTAYGAWGEKNMYGRTYMGVIRSTFLIGPDGAVAHAWSKVKVDGHSAEVSAAIAAHQAGTPIDAALSAAIPNPVPTVPGKAQAAKAAPKKVSAKKKAAPAPKKKAAVKKKSAPKKKVAAPKKKAAAKKKKR